MKQYSKMIGGILLVSGTTIGAAMLALPVSTGMAGFWPSIILCILYWMYMTYTAFLMLEANLAAGPGNNLMSMIKMTLGKTGQLFGWVIYLFLLYALTTAYIAGGAPIIMGAMQQVLGVSLPEWAGAIPLLVIFGFFVYTGTHAVDYVNRLLMLGLVVAFSLMMFFLTPHVDSRLLSHIDLKYIPIGLSVLATSFGFHIIIPSLTAYLDRDIVKLKKVIFIGGLIPLVVYVIWQFLALGIIPIHGPHGILEGHVKGDSAGNLISDLLEHSMIGLITRFFSFFAIVTSFLGVSLSLFDFLADGLKIQKSHGGRCFLYEATFLPPLLITLIDPRAFLSALEYAGAFGVVTLLGIFPALMVWSGRYVKKHKEFFGYRVAGGKPVLVLVILVSLAVIGVQIAIKSGYTDAT